MLTPSRLTQILLFVFSLFFGLAALLQWNDPDPVVWIVFYLGAALAGPLFYWKRKFFVRPYLLLALPFAVFMLFRSLLFQGRGLNPGGDPEFYSEVGGSLIVLLWLGSLFYAARVRHRKEVCLE